MIHIGKYIGDIALFIIPIRIDIIDRKTMNKVNGAKRKNCLNLKINKN